LAATLFSASDILLGKGGVILVHEICVPGGNKDLTNPFWNVGLVFKVAWRVFAIVLWYLYYGKVLIFDLICKNICVASPFDTFSGTPPKCLRGYQTTKLQIPKLHSSKYVFLLSMLL
jgi:hypothetical protein